LFLLHFLFYAQRIEKRMQKKGIFLKKGVAVAKSFAYIALLGDGHTHRGAAQSGLLFWKILFFQCFSLFDIVNIEKRDAGGVWLCEDLVTSFKLLY